MLKVCSCCRADYFARWRNEPVTLCPRCMPVYASGGTPAPLPDPAQLSFFAQPVRRPELEPLDDDARYWSLRQKATQAERRRYPYH